MPEKKFDLGDYVEVKDRIKLFYELFGQGRLVTGEVRLTTEPDGKPRVLVQGLAYRTPDDPLPGQGWSWMELPGKTSYTNGSELENVETSAWGRAIGSLGILIDRSIASGNEIRNKADGDGAARMPADVEPPEPDAETTTTHGGETEELLGALRKSGTVRKGTALGYQLDGRPAPDGTHTVGFRLEVDGDRAIPQVLVEGPAGEALYVGMAGKPQELLGQKVTLKGRLYNVKSEGRRGYYRLRVTEWETEELRFPAGDEPTEAESVPLFDDKEQAAIDAAVDTAPAGTAA